MELLNDDERWELKEKNLNMINEWVKDFCKDGFTCVIEHAFQGKDREWRVFASKSGISLNFYSGKYTDWHGLHDSSCDSIEKEEDSYYLIYRWHEIKAQIIDARKLRVEQDTILRNFII